MMKIMSIAVDTRTAPVALVEELHAGLSPWEACLRLAHLPHLLFLDSAQPSNLGRYSYVCADPVAWLSSTASPNIDPFELIRQALIEHALPTLPDLPPFQGGLAGLFSYELAHWIEHLPRAARDDFGVPDLALGLYDWVLAFDHERDRSWAISTGIGGAADERVPRAQRRLGQVRRWLERQPRAPVWTGVAPAALVGPRHDVATASGLIVQSNFERNAYLRNVARAIEYIQAGDCFQVNMAQRLLTPAREHPLALYDRLRRRNPAPFAGYFDLGDFVIASASPERFLRVQDRQVETRPIKGTRPRGQTPAEDAARAAELRASGKDRAENVMIVDLLRNDLGRVCAYGSVRVEALCRLESYPFVHHLVSEVRGRLRDDKDVVDLLRATFPGGSVTGAPKIRAMEIITELEQIARGPYCGCLGYLGLDGSMDTNLLIRTFTIGKGWVQFSVGGGIVADSDPQREYEETWHKAAGLLRALETDQPS